MKRNTTRIIICAVFVMLLSIIGFTASSAASDRSLTVMGITASSGTRTINNVYSDPVSYREIGGSVSLSNCEISYKTVAPADSVIYTAWYPDTTTGRVGNVIEYVCEPKGNRYTVTRINSSGDGSTYIPVGGFVLSLNKTSYQSFAKVGDTVTLGGTAISIPSKAVESTSGKRIAVDAMNVIRSKPMIVYYDYRNGEKTGTNIYGTEVICQFDFEKNCFTVKDFRDFLTGDASGSVIPESGFVLSAYGEGYRQLLLSNALFKRGDELKTVGFSYVNVNISELNSRYSKLSSDLESVIEAAQSRMAQLYDIDVKTVNGYISEAREKLTNLKSVKEKIEAEINVSSGDGDTQLSLLMSYNNNQLEIENLIQLILSASAESKVVSARAVWHRPIETTYAQIEQNVKTYKDIGINLIFVETLYNGYSVFKSDISEFPYHKALSNSYSKNKSTVYSDYLSAFVACCKEYGVEVHSWVENFYVGLQSNATAIAMHPDWIMYNDDGSVYQRKEGGAYVFIDPANEDVQDTLINYYNELFEKHPDIKGLNLDYIRYPVSSGDCDTGYTMAAMQGFYDSLGKSFSQAQLADRAKMTNKFKQIFNINYLLGGQAEADANYQAWVDYRTNVITEYVERIKNEVKEPNKILLSTAVFASLSESVNSKKQDWKTWFANGWIDIATPMAYYDSASDVQRRVEEMMQIAGDKCIYYTGLASSYRGFPAWYNKEQIEASYNAGASGYVIFCSTQIIGHNDVQTVLKSGVNSKQAVLPHASIGDILKFSFDDILDKADRLYIPAGDMTVAQRDNLEHIFANIISLNDGSSGALIKIEKTIGNLASKDIGDYADGFSRQRMFEQLAELSDLLGVRIAMMPDVEDETGGENDTDVENGSDNENNSDNENGSDNENNSDNENGSDNENNPDIDNGEENDSDNKPSEDVSDGESNEKPKGFIRRIIEAIIAFFKRIFRIK